MSSNRTYLITGANRGLGAAFVAHLLLRPATTVVAAVRDPSHPTSQALASLPKSDGSALVVVKIDAAAENDPQDAIAALQRDHAITSLDVVIANAGLAHSPGRVSELSSAPALEHFAVNSIAPIRLFAASAPLLKASENPVFVALSSLVGSIAEQETLSKMFPPMFSHYGASKAALNWFVRTLHFEEPWLASFVIHPGLVTTDMSAAVKASGVDFKAAGAISPEESVEAMLSVIDAADRETSGQFKKYDGTVLPW
ncbi:putative sterigmatocystin biosynthesis ketoreductase stcE [Colletotrichum chlorophyti]|uniref:Putative sterigmatocystin biosynthesis ketoreductase stcE n=1 Tax=Colletotrichum chlorophyti TaxID=708187 RepID=A0A1Q8RRT1_9PEZI|nr:putative sterigmatocystin biosynthesis ketoreductase stcE [Colletotrichum chlorophyti]